MNYTIFDNKGDIVNRIVADEAFAESYCAANGYTFSAERPEPEPEPEAPPTELEQLRADIDFLAALGGVTL